MGETGPASRSPDPCCDQRERGVAEENFERGGRTHVACLYYAARDVSRAGDLHIYAATGLLRRVARRIFLNKTLPRLLEEKEWTQERLGEATGIRRTDINSICRGRLAVGPSRLDRIAAALEVTLFDLGVEEPQAAAARSVAILDRVARLEAEQAQIRRGLDELRRERDDGP